MTRATTERPRFFDTMTMLLVGAVATHVMGGLLLGLLFALILYAVAGVLHLVCHGVADAIDRSSRRTP